MMLYKGSGVALVTPFDDGGINFKALDQLIEWHINEGTDALIVGGTTGEASTLTLDERSQLFTHTVQKVNKRIPVVAGTGSNSTATSIKYSQQAQACGVDGLLIVTPYYNKCTQKGLIAHYRAIAESVDLPIILYNVPSRTSVNMIPETVKVLSEIQNIVGIKEASADITQIVELFSLVDDSFAVYSGNDDHVFPLLALGAQGVISTVANIIPKMMHDLTSEYFSGNYEASKRIQYQINPLVKAVFTEVNPIPVKAGVNLLGFAAGPVRLPLTPAEPKTTETLIANLNALGVKI
ncbi:MAG TPA: 4-hydroxy-tetrahydrodipicolinate synthase [Clostridiales bacterium UBA8960]|jgi:4-hydroxy-tetrahydrodipicolinate synthase|nr:4-hydroxy-tetrahydrodipicolinate synthase [Clostridiales bacterium UBA8960]